MLFAITFLVFGLFFTVYGALSLFKKGASKILLPQFEGTPAYWTKEEADSVKKTRQIELFAVGIMTLSFGIFGLFYSGDEIKMLVNSVKLPFVSLIVGLILIVIGLLTLIRTNYEEKSEKYFYDRFSKVAWFCVAGIALIVFAFLKIY